MSPSKISVVVTAMIVLIQAIAAGQLCDPAVPMEPLTIEVTGTADIGGIFETVSGSLQIGRDETCESEPVSGNVMALGLTRSPDCIHVKIVAAGAILGASALCGCIGVFDVSCGDLSASLQIGTGPDTILASYTLVLDGPNTAVLNLNVTAPQDNLLDGPGSLQITEHIVAAGAGAAEGNGSVIVSTVGDPVSIPYSAQYTFNGNPLVEFPVPVVVVSAHSFDENGNIVGQVYQPFDTAPASSSSGVLLILALLLFAAMRIWRVDWLRPTAIGLPARQ